MQDLISERYLKPRLFGWELVKEWKVFKTWCRDFVPLESGASCLNYDELIMKFGESRVCLSGGGHDDVYLMDFLAMLRDAPDKARGLYLKDWHFCRDFPNEDLYRVPRCFEDDWLNKYALAKNLDDFRFVYLGADETWTPLHVDVFRSYSWSTNVCGIKEWILYPPEQEHLLKDKYGALVDDVRSSVDRSRFPNFHLATPQVMLQRPGETLFVPSNWFHQVRNIGITLSINHNWFNAFNLTIVTSELLVAAKEVARSISDLLSPPINMAPAEFHEECQKLLKMHFGMTGSELRDILEYARDQLLDKMTDKVARETSVQEIERALARLRY